MIVLPKVVSLGYDLGDGETIIDGVTFSYNPNNPQQRFTQGDPFNVRMPSADDAGKAIPTGYGYNHNQIVFVNSIINMPQGITNIHSYFKRKPMDLLRGINTKRYNELKEIFSTGQWPEKSVCPEVYSEEFKKFRECVQTFTNAIFSDNNVQNSVNTQLNNRDETVVCVGHPTNWDKLDQEIYRSILNGSILGKEEYLGKPLSFILAYESRAAYLYFKGQAVLRQGQCSLIIDVGSSTIDVTAVTQDSRNYTYNSGNNYLGVRTIDYMIKNCFFEQLNPNEKASIQDILKNNPSQENALVLNCRKAKETACSNGAGNIFYGAALVFKLLLKDDIDRLASTVPVTDILSQMKIDVAPEEYQKFGKKSWKTCFKEYLQEQKNALAEKNLNIGKIIITGGAAKMSFVPKIVSEVFPLQNTEDQDGSRTISRGLALVGVSDAKSKQFQNTVSNLKQNSIPEIISNALDDLAKDIAPIIEDIITETILKRVGDWRKGYIKTINDLTTKIKSDLSKENLKQKLDNSDKYKNAVKNWTVNKLGKDIAQGLMNICRQYNVTEFSVNDLNIMKNVTINPQMGSIEFDPLNGVVDIAAVVAGVIGGIIAVAILPTVLGIILGIIASFSTTIAGLLFSALALIPGPGWACIAFVVAVGAFQIVVDGVDSFRDSFNEKVRGYDLPKLAREQLEDSDVKSKLEAENISSKIKNAVLDKKDEISKEISNSISDQVEQKTDEIKYCIECR